MPGDDPQNVLPFPASTPGRPGAGVQVLAALITVTQAGLELAKLALLLGVLMLAGLGLGSLIR